MTTTLAVPKLYADVVALMATWAGVVSALSLVVWDELSTSTPSIAGTPTAAAEIRVRFSTGGTVGVDGILFESSVDDGAHWGTTTALGTASAILILGVTLSLSAGDVTDGDTVRWTQTAPGVVPQVFGWREPAKHTGTRRIVWVPGDDREAGEVAPARNPGGNPRSLWTLDELVTVYLEAADESSAATAEDELAQYIACRLLFDLWARAVYEKAHQTIEFVSARWVEPRGPTRRFGATLRVVLAVQAQIPDALQETASASTRADVHTTVVVEDDPDRDQTDEEIVTPTDTP